MKEQNMRFENEFEQELPKNTIDQFNTLQAFSAQPTSMLETTLADTLGLSMHNAVTNQQQSQMTTAASVTNACARLLQAQASIPSVDAPAESAEPAILISPGDRLGKADSNENEPAESDKEQKQSFSVFRFLKGKKGGGNEQ